MPIWIWRIISNINHFFFLFQRKVTQASERDLKYQVELKNCLSEIDWGCVLGDHQKLGAEIRHSGAAEGGEWGGHGGRCQRDQERHLRLQVRDDRDHASLGDEHTECLWTLRYGLKTSLFCRSGRVILFTFSIFPSTNHLTQLSRPYLTNQMAALCYLWIKL